MHAIQQKCRPKHQVLVLKCYPRITKGAVDVKPNSSELSYLLFYATSRRSKIQKIGAFLEKKTASDVWRLRIGNVQVTLQILAALIEKSPKDLPLFAQNVLKILGQVLKSNDITMVEASLPTFQTFCEHHDASSLFADQTYVRQYEDIVATYATFASTQQTPGKGTPTKPVALRWRDAGLEAIRSVAASETLSSVASRQLEVIIPMILENLWADDDEHIDALLRRCRLDEKAEANSLARRRTSNSTVRTNEAAGEANPVALSGSAADADKLAEENTALAAMQCLKQVFVVPNRAQLHAATLALLKFIREKLQKHEVVVRTDPSTGRLGGWAVKIIGLVARSAPVQDRYVILITTMDTLVKLQPNDESIAEQAVLVAMISSLLRSDVNLIGLSVMDVLLGLIQQMKKVLKHSGRSSQGAASEAAAKDEKLPPSPDSAQNLSADRHELLVRIQECIGDLATHVYYADQISDMISAILIRLKPQPGTNSPPSPEKADASPAPGNSAGSLPEDQHQPETFFVLGLAKTTALRAIRSILLVANPKTRVGGHVGLARNKVSIQVWEGTHWLLRDPDGHVRKAYAEAVVTWLDRETTKADLKARDELVRKPGRNGHRETSTGTFARRAVSSASNRERPVRVPRSHFLQMIHLAIYDNALQLVEFESDMVLCHILLTKLVNKLGVNAARYGLPMIFRLQEDIQEAETPISKVRLGCLCHGYFWALTEKFDFEPTTTGRAVTNEIIRRRSKHFWIDGVNIPSPLLETISTPGTHNPPPRMPVEELETEALLPFDDRATMVDCICTNYQESAISPPGSPPGSPGRSLNAPILSSTLSAIPPAELDQELPAKFREDMLVEWTREFAVMALQEGSKSASLNGSKTGTTATRGHRLTVNGGQYTNGHVASGTASPADSHPNMRPASHGGPLGSTAALRKSSLSRVSGTSSSSRGLVASVDQLKSALSGEAVRPPTLHTVRDDDSSESMASYDYSPSEVSFGPGEGADAGNAGTSSMRSRSKSRERKGSDTRETREDRDDVPPVPPLPSGVSGGPIASAETTRPLTAVSTRDYAARTPRRHAKSRGDSILANALGDAPPGVMDLQSLLKGIDSKSREHSLGNLTKPPY